MGASVSADGHRRALSIVTETTRKCQTPLRRTIRSSPRQSRQIAQNLRRRASRACLGRRALSIMTEMTRKGQTSRVEKSAPKCSPPSQSRQIAQYLRRRAPRARLGRRALSIVTKMTRNDQTAKPCARRHKIDAKNPLPAPQAGGRRPATGRPPSRRSSRRRCRAGSLAGRGVRGVGGVMAHPAAVAAAHPAKAAAEDCRICMVCEKVLRCEGRLPSFEVRVGA